MASHWVFVFVWTSAFDWAIKHTSLSVQVWYSQCRGISVEKSAEISFPDLMYRSKWSCHEFNKKTMPVLFWQAFWTISSGHDQKRGFFLPLKYKLGSQLRVWQLTQRTRTQWMHCVASSSLPSEFDNKAIYLATWGTAAINRICYWISCSFTTFTLLIIRAAVD